MPFISEISAAASSSCSLPVNVANTAPGFSPIRVEMVSKSVSRRLLHKFRDVSDAGLDYLPSRLWSPPFQPSMFLSSPGNSIVTPKDMLLRLRKLAQPRQRRRYRICFNAFWCFAKRSRGSFCCTAGSKTNGRIEVRSK
ncbi:hypothetical protein ACET3Z_005278 [Daucus carota]